MGVPHQQAATRPEPGSGRWRTPVSGAAVPSYAAAGSVIVAKVFDGAEPG